MALVQSTMLPLGSPLPSFELVEPLTGRRVDDHWLRGHVSVVALICNHCPYVVHLKTALVKFGEECTQLGVRMVAISSNDALAYPEDGPDAIAIDAKNYHYDFPYLFDETQEVARNFDATCTPDFFVFNKEATLAYRGQFDASRPSNQIPVSGKDLLAAVRALIEDKTPSQDQKPSIGCSIKWR